MAIEVASQHSKPKQAAAQSALWCISANAQNGECSIVLYRSRTLTHCEVARITISISDRDHLALKLLSLQSNKRVLAIIQEAIQQRLLAEGAYNLVIRSNPDADK
jgi:hypothetical protein